MEDSFYERVIAIVKSIPKGKVAVYSQIAVLAGSAGASRQVSWILHSSSGKYNLPWHRVVNSKGEISLKKEAGFELQKKLLLDEGVEFSITGKIDFDKFRM